MTASTRARLYLLGALFLGCAFVLVYRLYSYQVIQHEYYRRLANQEHRETITVIPRRGSLLDANGNPLALSVALDAVQVVGKDVPDPQAAAVALAPVLEMPPGEILARIDPASQRAVTIRAGLPAAAADRVRDVVRDKELYGISLVQAPVRQYPEGSIAAQVIGYLGNDRDGLAGLEYYFEDELAGEPGMIDTELDITRQELILARRVVKPPREGTDLVLTLDRFVQRVIERELAEGVRQNDATGGTIIVMDPSTGGILGMASYPTYTLADPMDFRPEEQTLHKSVAVTNQYEPGSVMKVVTMAAGLEAGVVAPTTTMHDGGVISFPGVALRNWDHGANGVISMTEVLIKSSNVGTYFVADRLGRDEFYRFLGLFGFGQPTGVELPGEVPGTMRTPVSEGWSPVDLATNGFGQGVAVTPLQMLTAIAAIGNDGVLMRPTLVKEFIRADGVQRPEPHAVRRVVSPETARTLREMMVEVIEQPALQPHSIPGYHIAGKTGTADFVSTGGYNTSKTYASVVALLPADTPRLAILIRIDAPKALYGGRVAVPILQRVGQDLLAYYRIPATAEGR
ncbi:MAG: penicillin-binding protein 2 [Chloroflexota bacterium]|nr:penicillin-binding protein 2 [Chloroflexota bacterium]